MSNCASCGGNCAACGGCGRALTITSGELEFLQRLGQIPFLPVVRKVDDMTPVYPEEPERREELSLVLQCLEKKRLITIDYDRPLVGFDAGCLQGYPVHGSIALTQRGYAVLETAEIQGIESEG